MRKNADKEIEDGRNYVNEVTLKLFEKERQLETMKEKYDLLKAENDEV